MAKQKVKELARQKYTQKMVPIETVEQWWNRVKRMNYHPDDYLLGMIFKGEFNKWAS